MGFFDRVTGGEQIPLHEKVSHVQLTQLGSSKLEAGLISGRAFDVIVEIKKCQPASLSEVARGLGMAENKVKYHIDFMLGQKWLTKV